MQTQFLLTWKRLLPSPQTSSLLRSPQNYSCPSVMVLAVPVAVRFLQRGNRELSRNMSSYLSLAAIAEADLLAEHTEAITLSVLGGRTHTHINIHIILLLLKMGKYVVSVTCNRSNFSLWIWFPESFFSWSRMRCNSSALLCCPT